MQSFAGLLFRLGLSESCFDIGLCGINKAEGDDAILLFYVAQFIAVEEHDRQFTISTYEGHIFVGLSAGGSGIGCDS